MLESFHFTLSDEESLRNNHCCEPWNTSFPTEDSLIHLEPKETWNHHKLPRSGGTDTWVRSTNTVRNVVAIAH